MTRNKFIAFVDQIKRLIREIDKCDWLNQTGPDVPTYGSFYEISLNILAETFDKKVYRKIFINMIQTYEYECKFTKEYNINGTVVRTPIELYDFAVKNTKH